jgi:hypothetical protein
MTGGYDEERVNRVKDLIEHRTCLEEVFRRLDEHPPELVSRFLDDTVGEALSGPYDRLWCLLIARYGDPALKKLIDFWPWDQPWD